MAFCVDALPGVGEHNEVHAEQKNPLGAVRLFSDGYHYVYLKGASSIVATDVVSYREGEWTAIRLAASAKGSVAVAMAAVDASTEYGWFGYVGSFTTNVLSTIVSNAHIFATGTAARVDDAVVKNDQVKNARTTTAGVAGNTATVSFNRAFIGSHDESA